MILIQDNFLPKPVFNELQNYCLNNDFKIVKTHDKDFSVLKTPEKIIPYLRAEGYQIIFSFIRQANKTIDTEYRIHADNIINGEKTAMASVLYINEGNITPNGTAFYKHSKHGYLLPSNCTEEEFDRLLVEDSNDTSKWEKSDHIKAKPNRLLMYNSNLFHSKVPDKIEKGNRIVLATFYKKL
ncbi:DUF6445 family protein [Tenacibaculum sp. 190524A02b]|uniref:DUF6445 family protein n=1 Tax=Tenacibaculum vairaonense TaxID=3137860 RepID=UPI0031FAA5CD